MIDNQIPEDDSIDLFRLIEILYNHWQQILLITLAGFIVSLTIVFITKPTFSATTTLKVGQVGTIKQITTLKVGQVGTIKQIEGIKTEGIKTFGSYPVEDPNITIERIKNSKNKYLGKIKNIDISNEMMNKSNTIEFDYTLSTIKSTRSSKIPLIKIEVKSGSTKLSQIVMLEVIEDIKKHHNQLASPVLDQYQTELASINSIITNHQNQIMELEEEINLVKKESGKTIEKILMTNLVAQKSNEIYQLNQDYQTLKTLLRPPYSLPAEVIGDIQASNNPVAPRKKQILILGVIGGLFLGIALVFMRTGWTHYKDRLQNSKN